jgi:hypothetical protein
MDSIPLSVKARGGEQLPHVYGVIEQLANKTYFGTKGMPGCDPKQLCYVHAPYGYLYLSCGQLQRARAPIPSLLKSLA